MSDGPEPNFKTALDRYAKVIGFLYSLAQDDLAKMTDEELAEFGAALDGPTQSNCWFAVHDAANYLRPIYESERYRRPRTQETADA